MNNYIPQKTIECNSFIQSILTLLMFDTEVTEYSGFRLNTMPADALAPKATRASVGMVLAV